MQIAAIIDASKEYPLMKNTPFLKELCHGTVIQTLIDKVREAGASQILMIQGEDAKAIKKHLAHRGVIGVVDENWIGKDATHWNLVKDQMQEFDRLLILTGDIPLVRVETLKMILASDEDVCVPVHSGNGLLASLSTDGADALFEYGDMILKRAFCEQQELNFIEIDNEDKGLSITVDTDEQYERAAAYEKEILSSLAMGSKLKLMISKGNTFFGPGAAAFFSKIDECGSISAACKAMDMAYSRGWSLVKNVELHMGFPFLERQSGGKGKGCSKLTPRGREFLEAYYNMEADMKRMSEALFSLHFGNKFD